MNVVQLGAEGVSIQIVLKDQDSNVPINLLAATVKQLIFKPPGGVKVTKTATFVTDGTDGAIQYVTETGFLNKSGLWKLQAWIEINGLASYSAVVSFKVVENL